MAKRKAKAAATSRNQTSPGGRRSTRRPHPGGTANMDVIGADVPTRRAKTVSTDGRPNETELTKLEREHELALSTGQAQPHPTMAPRAARTAPDSGPIGRAHQPMRLPPEGRDGDGIRVRATRLGEYGHRRRRPGDVFVLTEREGIVRDVITDGKGRKSFGKPYRRVLTPEEQFSEKWMERVDGSTPLRESTSADVMPKGAKRASDEATI